MSEPKKRRPFFLIQRGNVKVAGYRREQNKGGKLYASYSVPDHSSGLRKLWTFGDVQDAKDKATEIAEAIVAGKTDILNWEHELQTQIRSALEVIKPTGLSILPASQLFAQAVTILGGHDQLLIACQNWKQHRPDKPFTPKTVKVATQDYLVKQTKISRRRLRTLTSYLTTFTTGFPDRKLHEVESVELKDFVDNRKWAAKTRNEFLGGVSLLYSEAQFRDWVPKGCNPAKGIAREKLKGSAVHVFEPWEAKQLLSRVDAELVPFLALWCFAGIRKEEVSRMTFQQANRGLETGWIYLEANQTKTGEARSVPVMPNLKLWLMQHRKVSGDILPKCWQDMQSLDDITKYITRKTGVVWRDNAPRHSFGTYYFKFCKDPGAVVAAMGTSLVKFQKNYWCKANSITESVALDWFAIHPEQTENVVPLVAAVNE